MVNVLTTGPIIAAKGSLILSCETSIIDRSIISVTQAQGTSLSLNRLDYIMQMVVGPLGS